MIDKGRPLGSVNVRMRPRGKGRALLGRSTGDPFSSKLALRSMSHRLPTAVRLRFGRLWGRVSDLRQLGDRASAGARP